MNDVIGQIEEMDGMMAGPDTKCRRAGRAGRVQWSAIDTDHQRGGVNQGRQRCCVTRSRLLPEGMVCTGIVNSHSIGKR
jgi:hypothetical protein